MPVEIICSSVEDALPRLAAESFDGVLCDPPYGLSFMGKAWDHGVPGAPIWREVLRALRPGAHVLAFGGTRTFHRLTCAIEDAGFEIRDCAAWLYGSGFPKSLDVSAAIDKAAGAEREVVSEVVNRASFDENGEGGGGFQRGTIRVTSPATGDARRWSGYGTALKPAWEPCILAMKPCDGTFAANALTHGVAGLAIDAGRIAWRGPEDAAAAAANGCARSRARGTARQSQSIGKESRDGVNRYNPDALSGRWPANVLLDEEAAAALDAQSGGASRFFYCAKVSRAERAGSKHPTMKPIALAEYLARLILPPARADGAPRRLLVPFSGAGSEMLGALVAGWDEVIGIEREAEYVADARRRIADRFGVLHPVREAVA